MEKILLSKNQIELMNVIQSFRFMPQKALLDMVKLMGLYKYRQSLGYAVRKLEEVGYIDSFLYGNNWKVLYITRSGAERLSFELGLEKQDIYIPRGNKRVQFATLEHTVEISSIFSQFVSVINGLDSISLVKWLGDQRVRCKYSFRTPTGKKITKFLVPDSYFEIQFNNKVRNYFLEYDTGSMDFKQLSLKYQRYFEYFYYGEYESFPIVVFVTRRSRSKLKNLLKEPEVDLNQALRNRNLFSKSKNLLWSAIGKTPNLRSISSLKIKEFLNHNFTFYHYEEEWIKDLLKQ